MEATFTPNEEIKITEKVQNKKSQENLKWSKTEKYGLKSGSTYQQKQHRRVVVKQNYR